MTEMDSQEIEQAENQTRFDLNEDPNSYFNVYQDTQLENNEEVFQELVQDIQENLEIIVQNVQTNVAVEPNFPRENEMSADPIPQASGSLPSAEVQLMAHLTPEQNRNLNFSTSTMESEVEKFLISPLPTPSVLPSPPPITNKNTGKLPNIPDLFDSLDTFGTKEGPSKTNVEAFASAKPSRAEKMATRALRVYTKIHKIACVLAKWTINVHALGLVLDPPVFEDPTSSDSRDFTP